MTKPTTLAQKARAAGLSYADYVQSTQHKKYLQQLRATESPTNSWNKPGLSLKQKQDLRDEHLRHLASVAWRHPNQTNYENAKVYAQDALPPGVADLLGGASGYIGASQGDSGAPTPWNNIALIGIAGLIVYIVIRKKRKR